MLPTQASFLAIEISRWTAMSLLSRSLPIWVGTCSISAAGVPGRGEYRNMYAPSNWNRSMQARVPSNSSSVSPGKPTIMSVVSPTFGIFSRSSSTIFAYDSTV